nr:MAG TPA: DNA binding protein [Microviridae sp.]
MDIFALRDRKAAFTVFVKDSANSEDFERWFITNMLLEDNGKSVFQVFPEDYDIYKLCSFDRTSMLVTPPKSPKLICSVADLYSKYKLARPHWVSNSDET